MNLNYSISNNLKKWQVVVMIEVSVLIFLGIAIVMQSNRKEPDIEISLSDWKATNGFVYDAAGWYVDEDMLDADLSIDKPVRIYGPYAKLSRGTYSVSIEYECEYDQSCQIYANDIQDTYIKGRAGRLSKNYGKASYDFRLTEEIDNFEFVVDYNRKGFFRVKSIKIQCSSAGVRSVFMIICLLSLCINAGFYCSERKRKIFIEIIGIILLVSLPLFVKGIYDGHDISFHLMRIEGLADELRRGVFPVRMSSIWMDGYGYPVSVFYGDILLYIAAVLRIMGFSIVVAYKLYVFLINTGTVIVSYICFNKIFKDDKIAGLTTLVYATAGYRTVCIFVRSAVGEYSAMMFLPLIALAVYRFYMSDADNWTTYKRNAFIMASGMTGLIGSHILSIEMVVVTLVVLCGVCWRKTFTRNVLCGYILATIETIVMNLYFVIPFLDYYSNVKVRMNTLEDNIQIIQQQGAYIGQYFAFFQDMFGQNENEFASRMNLTPGMALMFTLIIAIIIWLNGNATKEIKILSVVSVFILFMASDLFPWNHIGLHYKWGEILSQVQFPWCYIGIAAILLTILLGCVCNLVRRDENYCRKFFMLIIGSCLIAEIFYVSNYGNEARMLYYYDTAEVDTYALMGKEYLLDCTDINSLHGKVMQENMKEVSLISRDGTYMELYCETSDSKGTVEVPMLNYKGYKVWDEAGKEYEITDGENKVIQFSVPSEFAGNIKIDFVEPWYWKMGELGSVFIAIFICLWEFRKELANCIKRMRNVKCS